MAEYTVDVKAKLDVSEYKQDLQNAAGDKPITVKVIPNIEFNTNINADNLKNLQQVLSNYFTSKDNLISVGFKLNEDTVIENISNITKKLKENKRNISVDIAFTEDKKTKFEQDISKIQENLEILKKQERVNLKFGFDSEDKKIFNTDITNIKKQEDSISNVNIGLGFNQEQKERLGNEILATKAFLESFNADKINISIQDDQLAQLKNNIENYFQNNPIVLTISQDLNDIDLGSISNKVAELLELQSEALEQESTKQQEIIQETTNIQEEATNAQIQRINELVEQFKNEEITLETLRSSFEDIRSVAESFGLESIINALDESTQEVDKFIQETNEIKEASDSISFYQERLNYLWEHLEKGSLTSQQVREDLNELFDLAQREDIFNFDNLEETSSQGLESIQYKFERLYQWLEECDNEEEKSQIEKFKALEAQYQKHLAEKRELRDKENKENEQHMRDAILIENKFRNDRIEIDKQTYDEREALALQYSDKLKEISEQTKNDIDNNAKKAEIVEVYTQKITQIVNSFREGFINIEQAEDQIWEKMSEAKKDGIIPQEVFDNTKQLLNNLEEEAEKSFDAWREKQSKLYDDLQAKTDKQKEYDEKIWEDKAKSVQDMYDKQQISAEEYISRINTLLPEAYEKGYQGAEKYAEAVDKIEKEQDETAKSAENLNKSFDNMFNSLMGYFGVTKIFDAIQNSFSKMVKEVQNLDTELTEFSKVSDLSAQETEAFVDNAYRLGETVAKTGTDVVTATTLFKKMGYEVEQSMDFAKDALMWTNVADGMVSVEDAANMLISTMKAYGEEAVSTTQIIDALNEVSNNYSTSSSALSNNLSTVAATLAASGTDLYQTIGLMTAGIEVMPDKASKVANGLKTISQRIRQIDGDTADKLDEFLGSKGKSRFDEATGQLKSTYEILSEVSKLWNDLSINERQYIGEVMAGKNQITVLNAVMTNFATAVNATETAMKSAGSAAEENKRVLESIQGHINGFKSAFSKLSKDLISSDLFKNIIDVGTFLIKLIDVIASNPLTKSGFFLLISMLGSNSILNNIEKIGNRIENILSTVKAFPSSLDPISLGITAIVAALGVAYNIIRKSNEEVEQAKQNIIDARKKEEESIDSKIKKYEELKKLYDEENLTREEQLYILRQLNELNDGIYLIHNNIDEEIRLQNEKLYVQKSLLAGINEEASKSAISFDSGFLGIKDVTRSILDLNESVSNIVFDKSGKIKYTDLIDADDISLNIKKDTLQGILDALNEIPIESRGIDWLNLYDTVSGDLKAIQGEVDNVNKYAKDAVTNMLQATGRNIKTMTDEELGDLKKQIDGIKEKSDIIFTISTDPDQIEQLGKMIDSEITARAQAASTATSDEIGIIEASLSGAMAMMSDYVDNMELLNQAHMEFSDNGEISAETLRKIADAGLAGYLIIDELTKSLDVDRDAFLEDNKAIEENAIASYVAGQRTKLLADLKDESAAASNQHASASDDEKIAVNNLAKALENATDETSTLAATQMLLNQIEAEGITTTDESGKALDSITSKITNFITETKNGIQALHTLFDTASTSSGRTGTTHSASHGSGSSSSRSSTSTADREAEKAQREAEQAAKDAQKAWKDAFEVEYKKLKTYLDSELITYEEYYDALEILNEQFFAGRAEFEEEYWKYKDEAIKGYKKYVEDELKDYFKKGETSLKRSLEKEEITQEQYFDYLEELYKAYYTDKDEYEEAMAELSHERFMYEKKQREQEIKDLQDQISDLFKHGETLLEHQLAMDEITEEQYYDALTLLYEAYYDDKEKYEEEYWKLQEKIYAYQKKKRQEELDDLENQLEELYNEAERLHKEYIESLEEENDALETTTSYAIDVLDEEIDKLKAEKSALDEANEALSEQIKLQELEDNLEKAKQKKVRVYRKGQGFVYEQDTKAISEAQTALDEYKKELQHKKQLSMIDEEISKLEEYKKEWKSITESYKNAQDEMTAKGILGENARERILAREHSAVELVGKKYENVKDRIKAANDATIDNMEAYIGDENTANTLSYEIKKIKDKIDEVKSKTVTVGVQANSNIGTIINDIKGKMDEVKNKTATISVTDNASSTITNIIGAINTLKGKLEQSYSTQNMTDWLTKWKTTIYQAYLYSQEYGITPSTGGGSGSGSGGSGSGGSGSDISVGTRIPETDEIIAGIVADNDVTENLVRQYMNAKDYEVKGTDYDTGKLQIGPVGESGVTWLLSQSYLSSGSGSSGSGDSGSSGGGEYTEPVYGSNGAIIGYNHYSGDGTLLYYEAAHAQGTLGTTTKTFLVNEKGMEAMVTPEGTVISAPTTGYGVIKNEYTERLTDFAADPMSFLNKTFSGYSGTYKNNNSSNETININGNLTLPNVTDGQSFVDSIRNVALQYTTRRK